MKIYLILLAVVGLAIAVLAADTYYIDTNKVYLVFTSLEDASNAVKKIDASMGLPKYGVNAATGKLATNKQPIVTWSHIIEVEEGKTKVWYVKVPQAKTLTNVTKYVERKLATNAVPVDTTITVEP